VINRVSLTSFCSTPRLKSSKAKEKNRNLIPINNISLTAKYPSKNTNISFDGIAWSINLNDLGISRNGHLKAEEAIRIYDKLRIGNYLDANDDLIYPSNRIIREENFEFLERVINSEEQRKFISYFKNLTGFPDLQYVSYKIEQELLGAANKASNILKSTGVYGQSSYEILNIGYDTTCSVGKKIALPGSDIDKAYIILRGSSFNSDNLQIIDAFKGHLWENTDQRILSYNHNAAFPQVYTIQQIKDMVNVADRKIKQDYLSAKDFALYKTIMSTYQNDYIKANQFFIRLSKLFPVNNGNSFNPQSPTKEFLKNFGFFIETFREGKHLLKNSGNDIKELDELIRSSLIGHLTNISQLSAIKGNSAQKKTKIIQREKLSQDFNSWITMDQYLLIKSIIRSYSEDNKEFNPYFVHQRDGFTPLIRALTT